MKKVILFVFVLAGLNGYAQDFKIDSDVKYAGGIVSQGPNYIKLNYHHISRVNDSTWSYQAQFITEDSLGNRLLPNDDLTGSRSSGTVKEFTLTAEQANLSTDSLIQLFWKPYLAIIYPGKVGKGKDVFDKK